MNTIIMPRRSASHAAASAQWRQSLADGAPGIALPHIGRAHAGRADWTPVHRLAQAMTRQPVHAHPQISNLFRGAPAVAYALHTAGHRAYRCALAMLDRSIAGLTRHRLDAAHQRIDEGRLAQAREYDLINGLTGLGAYLLHRGDEAALLRDVLAYLVRLTRPISVSGQTLPGWWATGSPDRRRSSRWADGHAGFGMARGISGPLALLSAAMRHGVTVTGHRDAIGVICAWLDQWRTRHDRRSWWPEVIGRHELRTGTITDLGIHRPSWCYGTPGIARAQHLAGIATDDHHRAEAAEQALLGCLTDDRQLALLTDAATQELSAAATHAARLLRLHLRDHGQPADEGLLEGTAGITLADPANDLSTSTTAWDTCLLVR